MTRATRATPTGDAAHRLLAVRGHPVGHSLSPAMHGAALAALGLSDRVSYVARDVAPDALAAAVEELRDGRLLGASVTLPHKRAVMALCDRVEPDAALIGAVNTLVREPDGTIVGVNTDAPGLGRALADAGVLAEAHHALVVGAGGAARAAVVTLAHAGVERIHVAARRRLEADALVASLASTLGPVGLAAIDLAPEAIRAAGQSLTLVIQATSATLDEGAGTALARLVPFGALAPGATVCDLVYRPRRTAVLRAAETAGLRTVDGTGMLVHQGALALERWLGVSAPIGVMRAAVERALGAPPLQT